MHRNPVRPVHRATPAWALPAVTPFDGIPAVKGGWLPQALVKEDVGGVAPEEEPMSDKPRLVIRSSYAPFELGILHIEPGSGAGRTVETPIDCSSRS